MTIKATVVIQKESKADPRKPPGEKDYYAALHLFSEDGKEYGGPGDARLSGPRYLSSFEEAGNLLQREAGVSYEQLQGHKPRYDKGEAVRIALTLENEESIAKLGFGSRAA